MPKRRKVKIFSVAMIFVLAIVGLSFYLFETDILQHPSKRELNQYRRIKDCEKLEQRFESDLQNNRIKFFVFGLYSSESEPVFYSIGKQYNIKLFSAGCISDSYLECYNRKVNQYLIKEFNDSSLIAY